MSSTISKTIKVDVLNIAVGTRYFSFNYRMYVDGKFIGKDEYCEDHIHSDRIEEFKKELEDGTATKLALEILVNKLE